MNAFGMTASDGQRAVGVRVMRVGIEDGSVVVRAHGDPIRAINPSSQPIEPGKDVMLYLGRWGRRRRRRFLVAAVGC